MHRALVFSVVAALGGNLHAAPYLPSDDRTVLERLPVRPGDPTAAELKRLRAAVSAAPGDAAAAARLAQHYFALANAAGDPRYVGYAQAVLRPWSASEAPAEVLFARGLLRQYRHDFDGALEDLAGVLRQQPQHADARAWRAAIFMVRADYAAAARECAALEDQADRLLAAGCSAYVAAATGHTRSAYALLAGALREHPDAGSGLRLWALTRLAEMAWRLEESAIAERHFREALALGLDDNFLLAAYADFLLEQGRARDVVALLGQWSRSDTLLLRLALAERALHSPAWRRHTQTLEDRFAAAALRGEQLHLAEEARFLLSLKDAPKPALAAAQQNWRAQREPRDAAVLLEAALAAGEPQAAQPVLRWLRDSGFESRRLQQLAAQVK